MSPALIALAVAAFAIGTTEFVMIGLIPDVARDLTVTIPQAGLLVTGYALAVTVGAPTITALTGRLPRRGLAVGLMGLFTLGNLLGGAAPTYEVLLSGRIMTGVAHGVFFAVGAPIAMSLADRERGAQAVAMMFAGLTLAMVIGVPFGTIVGQSLGWRAPLLAVAVFGCLATALLRLLLPREIPHARPAGLQPQFAVLAKPRLLALYFIAMTGFGGSFVVFTFLAPLLMEVTRVSPAAVSLALMAFGAAAMVGNFGGGRLSDALGTRRGLTAALVGLVLALAALPFSVPHVLTMFANLLLWSACCFCLGPIVQSGVVAAAEEVAPDAVATASGFNIAAFNFGIATFSAIGGLLVAGPGIMTTPWGGAAAGCAALVASLFVRSRQPGRMPISGERSGPAARSTINESTVL